MCIKHVYAGIVSITAVLSMSILTGCTSYTPEDCATSLKKTFSDIIDVQPLPMLADVGGNGAGVSCPMTTSGDMWSIVKLTDGNMYLMKSGIENSSAKAVICYKQKLF
jgi:hypothetical protein